MKNRTTHFLRLIAKADLLFAVLLLCQSVTAQRDVSKFIASDKMADTGIVNLYRNMAMLAPDYIMIGHQDALSYGINWKKGTDRSDIKDITGSHPAVFGWDIGGIELGNPVNLDSVPFDEMRKNIISVYLKGGINTISWHDNNPVTGKSSWVDDKNNSNGIVVKILPGGSHHEEFKKQLDKVADFIKSLKAPDGSLAPIVFQALARKLRQLVLVGSNTLQC